MARENGRIIGTTLCFRRRAWIEYLGCEILLADDTYYLDDSYVLPEFRGLRVADEIGGLRRAFMREAEYQRSVALFWPENLKAGQKETPLPSYVRKLLKARLRVVYYYNTAAPDVEIHVTQPVEDMVQKSIARLPGVDGSAQGPAGSRGVMHPADNGFLCIERYRQVSVDEFLQDPRFASMWID